MSRQITHEARGTAGYLMLRERQRSRRVRGALVHSEKRLADLAYRSLIPDRGSYTSGLMGSDWYLHAVDVARVLEARPVRWHWAAFGGVLGAASVVIIKKLQN